MNASPEPHELFGYRYILSTTTSWCAENPIVLEIKIPQITRNAPASMYKRLVNMICLHFSLIEMYFSVNQDSEHCLKLLYIKKRKASKSTKKQLTTKSHVFYPIRFPVSNTFSCGLFCESSCAIFTLDAQPAGSKDRIV